MIQERYMNTQLYSHHFTFYFPTALALLSFLTVKAVTMPSMSVGNVEI